MTAGADSGGALAPPDLERAIAALGPEPSRCLLCSGREFARLFHRWGKWYWRCRSCALVFVHDIYPEFVTDTAHLDRPDDDPDHGVVARGYNQRTLEPTDPRRRQKYAALLRSLQPYRSLARLLDVGCGQGHFLEAAAAAGWRAEGLDLLPALVELARQRGFDVKAGELAQAGFAPGSFDVVTMFEVIEHVIEPVALMSEVVRVLRPGGVAVVGTGNARSWAAGWRGGDWPYYRFGGHLHIRFYSPASAAALARAAGFARVECRTHGFAFREAEEVRGRWYKPVLKLSQAPLSALATLLAAGHRLVMIFHKGEARPAGGS